MKLQQIEFWPGSRQLHGNSSFLSIIFD